MIAEPVLPAHGAQRSLLQLEIGKLYSNEEIYRSLGVGNAGGLRIQSDQRGAVRRAAVFTSMPTARQLSENPYCDRLEGPVLIYTGVGEAGDQATAGINSRLQQQVNQHFPIYGFAQVRNRRQPGTDNKRWQFIGLLEYTRSNREQQIDADSQLRSVWLFELFVHEHPSTVVIADDQQLAKVLLNGPGRHMIASDREVLARVTGGVIEINAIDTAGLENLRRKLLGKR